MTFTVGFIFYNGNSCLNCCYDAARMDLCMLYGSTDKPGRVGMNEKVG